MSQHQSQAVGPGLKIEVRASMFSYLSSVLLLLAAHAPAPASAVSPDSVLTLPEVTVTATRIHGSDAGPPTRVTQIRPGPIAAVSATDVGSLLAARSGSFIRQYGAGGLATLSLRGAAPVQTLLLVDGHALTDPQLGQVDLTLLPTAVLERIEVVHGAGSALYGSAGMAGVVNLQTLPSSIGTQYSATLGGGAFGSRRANLRVSHGTGRLSGAVVADLVKADNDFHFETIVGGQSRRQRRTGSGFERGALYATGEYATQKHLLRAAGWYTTARRGLPGPSTSQPVGERQWDDHLRLWVSDRIQTGNGIIRIGASAQWNTLRYLNPQLELDQTSHSTVHALEAEYQAKRGQVDWTFGANADYGTARHPSLASFARIWHGGLFLAAAHRGLGAYPAIRMDSFEGGGGQTLLAITPRLAFRTRAFGSRVEAYAGFGRSFRAPTMNERYWQPGGNPNLKPERGWAADGGVRSIGGPVSAEVSLFASRQRDEITWLRSTAGYYEPFNIRRTRSTGFELSVDVFRSISRRLLMHGEAGARFTYTRAQDLSDSSRRSYGHQLRYVPREQLKIHAVVHAGSVWFGADMQSVGRRFVTTDGTQWVPPYSVVDVQLGLRRAFGSTELELSGGLKNVLNTRYHVIQHYPMPPRHLGMALSMRSSRDNR